MAMNIAQKVVLVIYALVVVALCIYVPWMVAVREFEQPFKYGVIWSPPQYRESRNPIAIDIRRLGVEIFAVSVVAGVSFFISKSKK